MNDSPLSPPRDEPRPDAGAGAATERPTPATEERPESRTQSRTQSESRPQAEPGHLEPYPSQSAPYGPHSGPQPYGPPGAPPAHGPYPPPVRPEPAPKPIDIGTAQRLWWAIVGLGLIQVIASVIAGVQQRGSLAEQMRGDLERAGQPATQAMAELMVTAGLALAVLIGIVLAGLGVLFAHLLGRGKLWARTVLTIAGVWLVLMAAGTLFALDTVSGAAALAAGAATLVQGVLAAGAVFLAYRPDSTAYFLVNRR